MACRSKILFRLNHRLSAPYRKLLEVIPPSSDTPQFVPGVTYPALDPKHDKLLQNDQRFFKILPRLSNIFGDTLKAPRLLNASSDPTVFKNPILAYNADTYIEYHRLLNQLLVDLQDSLTTLCGLNASASEEIFDCTVSRAVVVGDALQAMAGGHIIKVHMKFITLSKSHRARALHMDEEGVEDEGEGEEAQDPELYQIRRSSLLPWEACCEWLKLMVVHFDAVHILIGYMKRVGNPEVTIKVIVTPHPDDELLPWKQLLRDERYFDEGLGIASNPSIKDIITYIENWQKHTSRTLPNIKQVLTKMREFRSKGVVQDDEIDGMIKKVESVTPRRLGFQWPGDELEFVAEIIQDMRSLKDGASNPKSTVDEIIGKLEALSDKLAFFATLNQPFKGSVHCEFSLASFMMWHKISDDKMPPNFLDNYKQILDELSVSCHGIILTYNILKPFI